VYPSFDRHTSWYEGCRIGTSVASTASSATGSGTRSTNPSRTRSSSASSDAVAWRPVATTASGSTAASSVRRWDRQFARSSAVGSRFDPSPSQGKHFTAFVTYASGWPAAASNSRIRRPECRAV
jgi:3-deoxy-D-arabino-heptulosonate 7-phosphate (DAHP) synthase class II